MQKNFALQCDKNTVAYSLTLYSIKYKQLWKFSLYFLHAQLYAATYSIRGVYDSDFIILGIKYFIFISF